MFKWLHDRLIGYTPRSRIPYISTPISPLRQGSNERDSSAATARSSPVMLSAAKHLSAARDRPFAVLRVTRCNCSNGQVQFVQIEPCLDKLMRKASDYPQDELHDRQAQIASLSNVYACDPRFYVHDRDYALAPRKEHGHL